MEQKFLKTAVFTNKTVFCETFEQSVDTDFTLPDYLGDIAKILKCVAKPRIALKSASGKSVTVSGAVQITVFYCDENGKISSVCKSYPFEKTKETDRETESADIFVTSRCGYINCHSLSGRKIDIHGAIQITLKVNEKTANDIISDISDSDIEVLSGTVPATTPTGYAEKYLILEEEVELGGESGERIMRYDACTSVKECKIVGGKLIVKGDMLVNIKYLSESGVKCFKSQIPFSGMLEIETAGDTCECDAKVTVAYLDVCPKNDSSGEFSLVSINAKLLVCAESFCNNDVAVIYDAYSKEYNAEIEKSNICFNKLIKNVNEIYNLKQTVKSDTGDIASVLDCWCDVKVNDTSFEESSLKICGTANVCIITEDSDSLADYGEKAIEFEYKYPLEAEGTLKCEPEITVISCGYTITSSDSLEISLQMRICAPVYRCETVSVVTDIKTESEAKHEKRSSAMIIYYAEKGEKLWEISKKYSASNEEILKLNSSLGDVLTDNMPILIPLK